ncbi:ubiquitin receptor RAD23d-like isoform X2 [Typha latifolia]|uniref:ubiquitin receptor RAD23d-like isoform X2 n=1 Tax=Typha latifolia TaxID=4733 RepID=UPI003C2E1FCC
MKIIVKTLGGYNFDIEVKPQDKVLFPSASITCLFLSPGFRLRPIDLYFLSLRSVKVAYVKKVIEATLEGNQYPADRQMLIHEGVTLKDDTTLDDNKIAEYGIIVVMLSKVSEAVHSTGSTANSFSQGRLGFLHKSPQFRTLMVLLQSNPQIIKPMLQELGKQNPHIFQLIQDNEAEFSCIIKEPPVPGKRIFLSEDQVPQITFTLEEQEAIRRALMDWTRSQPSPKAHAGQFSSTTLQSPRGGNAKDC